jgi:membrane protease YdiL (CAAX protease family)
LLLCIGGAALSLLAGWFLPPMLMGEQPGFAALMLLSAFQEILLIGLPATLLLLMSEKSARATRAMLHGPGAFQAGLTMLAAVAYTMVGLIITLTTYLALTQFGVTVVEPASIVPSNLSELLLAAACAAFIPAICEELMFRGLIQGFLSRRFSSRISLYASAALFALLHFSLLGFPVLFVIGLFLSMIMRKSNSLPQCILFHAMYNFSVLTINFAGAMPGLGLILACIAILYYAMRTMLKEDPHGMQDHRL